MMNRRRMISPKNKTEASSFMMSDINREIFASSPCSGGAVKAILKFFRSLRGEIRRRFPLVVIFVEEFSTSQITQSDEWSTKNIPENRYWAKIFFGKLHCHFLCLIRFQLKRDNKIFRNIEMKNFCLIEICYQSVSSHIMKYSLNWVKSLVVLKSKWRELWKLHRTIVEQHEKLFITFWNCILSYEACSRE